jgi:hypothetical protein
MKTPMLFCTRGINNDFAVNVWAVIMEDWLIGPYVLPHRLTAAVYHNLLVNVLPELIEDVPLWVQYHMWFMHDGALAHFLIHVELPFSSHVIQYTMKEATIWRGLRP